MLVYRVTDAEGETLNHAPRASGSGYTLCGFTLDVDRDVAQRQDAIKGKITFPQCLTVIHYCKGLKRV